MVKISIPVESFQGENSLIFPHFGRAPFFAVVTLNKDNIIEEITPIQNSGEHFGGRGAAEALALKLNIDAVIVKGMGPRGLQAFQEKGVSVLTGNVKTVKEAINAYSSGTLIRLTEPCREAQHR
ncbi:NifB/NifX family molybdenum-iron cluster-binding protein [[Eubacterium] cellulosolvens]